MSPDKADTEVPAGGERGLRKRLALISASVLLITAGAFAYHHNASEGETPLGASGPASGPGLRLPQGRRLPHYTTYGGTSYDFMGESPPAGCCCVMQEDLREKEYDLGGATSQCKMMPQWEYNPTMPPSLGYNPTMPPLQLAYNPTRPPVDLPAGYNPTMPPLPAFPGMTMKDDGKGNLMSLPYDGEEPLNNAWPRPLWKGLANKEGFAGCCCSNELKTGGRGRCEVAFMSREGTWVR